MTVEPYNPSLRPEWDDVVAQSRNGTFLHLRGYMDYHAERFADASLIARDKAGRAVAALPANRVGETLSSHGGLTYGGWLMTPRADMPAMMEVWSQMTGLLRSEGVRRLIYKPVPHIYHRYPAEEDLYALWRAGGALESTLISSVVDLSCPPGFDKTMRRNMRKAEKCGLAVGRSDRWADFWQILERRLADAYNTRPVHSLDEIELLRGRFPGNIELYTAERDGDVVAGVVMYHTATVSHCQYICSSEAGRECHALPLLFSHIAANLPAGTRYLDYGTSNEDHGRYLNEGLIRQKASFGARGVAYQTYVIEF